MPVNPKRIQKLNEKEYKGGAVVYQMCRDIRAHDNDALLFAQELAKSKGAQLIVNYVIWNYEWEGATRRLYSWVIPSLREVEETLRAHNIPLTVTFEDKKLFKEVSKSKMISSVGAVVIDQLPLRFMKKWKEIFLSLHKETSLYEVDTHNCIPVWEASPKQEFAARTIRGKIHAKLPSFLEEHGKLQNHNENDDLLKTLVANDWKMIASKIKCKESVMGVGSFAPGARGAEHTLKHFLSSKLTQYDTSRNDFTQDGQSNLSPYIAHGNISRRRIILELLKIAKVKIEDAFDPVMNGSNGRLGSVAAFIEECVVRAELSDNYCYYNSNYDKVAGFPAWAQATLDKARTDKRTYTYSLEDFEKGRTHDDLWNAAQLQMVKSGKMHGYMRMYWAKKILEWTKSPEEAMMIAVYLNDTYELDGRDPNGYVGCAWSIGGVHDRGWFPRPIFGTVRYMAESGVMKRGDISFYKDRWLNDTSKLF